MNIYFLSDFYQFFQFFNDMTAFVYKISFAHIFDGIVKELNICKFWLLMKEILS